MFVSLVEGPGYSILGVHILDILIYPCGPSTRELEAGGPRVHEHPLQLNKFEARAGYMKPCLIK